jgi:hypothetical protein
MKCNEIRGVLPDLAAGMGASTPGVEKHIASCAACAAQLSDLRKTMAVLDEWQAPEPSPYFDTRLQARLREEMARPAAGWLSWMRRPASAMSLAAVLFAGALVVGINKSYIEIGTIPTNPPTLGPPIQPGTAVGDLQALDRNDELYADFDMLDELQVQDDVTANP